MHEFLEFRVVFVNLVILALLFKKIKHELNVEVRLKITKFVILVIFAFFGIKHQFFKYGNIA